MSEAILRISKLVEHWIEHNEEHVKRFREVAMEAEAIGLEDAARNIREAAANGEEVTSKLRKALDSLT